MKGYSTTEDSNVIIQTNASGIKLYNASKKAIEDNSKQIDKLVQQYRKLIRISEFGEKHQLNIDPVINKDDNIQFIELYSNFLDATTELFISCRELYIAKTKTEQIYYIKNIYLCLARYIDRMKQQSRFLQSLSTDYDCLSLFDEYTSTLRVFNNKYINKITNNRNRIVAHYDKNISCIDYYDITLKYDAEAICQMTIQFMDTQKLLSALLATISSRLLEKLFDNCTKLEREQQAWKQSLLDHIEKFKGTPAYGLVKNAISGLFEKVDGIITNPLVENDKTLLAKCTRKGLNR